MPRSSYQRWSMKKLFLKISQYSKVFPVNIMKFFKSNYFEEHLHTVASDCRLQQQWAMMSNIFLLNWMKWGKI